MKILMTGFDPFGGEKVNPAFEAVKRVTAPEGVELIRLEVPTVFGKAVQTVAEVMEKEHPDAVLSIGQAGGRASITPERVGINLMDCTAPDNEGNQPSDEPIVPGGENAFFATIPVKEIVSAVKEAGIPAQISNSAGTYVCNNLMYGVLNLCHTKYPGTRAGFIHVPFLPEQTVSRPNSPSMSLDSIVAALEIALRCIRAQP